MQAISAARRNWFNVTTYNFIRVHNSYFACWVGIISAFQIESMVMTVKFSISQKSDDFYLIFSLLLGNVSANFVGYRITSREKLVTVVVRTHFLLNRDTVELNRPDSIWISFNNLRCVVIREIDFDSLLVWHVGVAIQIDPYLKFGQLNCEIFWLGKPKLCSPNLNLTAFLCSSWLV